eukprot:COSAG06_NODE_7375_length_2524_cov_1.708041_4_plen_237_part_00
MSHFFRADEAATNGDPPPLPPPSEESNQASAIADSEELEWLAAAASEETNPSPVYGSPILLPSMHTELELKLEQQVEVERAENTEQELHSPLEPPQQREQDDGGGADDMLAAAASTPPTLPPKPAGEEESEGQEQEQQQEEHEGAALPVEMPPGDGPRHLCRQRRQVKREGFVASDEPGLSFAQPKGGMSQARRAPKTAQLFKTVTKSRSGRSRRSVTREGFVASDAKGLSFAHPV